MIKPVINKRVCECCNGTYATGKSYGDYWCQLPEAHLETKGLCEFCNPAPDNKWYTKKMKCHVL